MSKYSSYNDAEIIGLVDDLTNNRIQCPIKDLRDLQSELINRRCDSSSIANISTLIMTQMAAGEKTETKAPNVQPVSAEVPVAVATEPVSEAVKPTFVAVDEIRQPTKPVKKAEGPRPKPVQMPEPVYEGEDRFPILTFLITLHKIVAWAGLVAILAGAGVYGFFFAAGNVNMILCVSGGALLVAAVWLMLFSAKAETVKLKLEIERLLRRIGSDI